MASLRATLASAGESDAAGAGASLEVWRHVDDPDLFGDNECLYLAAGWIFVWFAAHNLVWVAWQRGRVPLVCRSRLDRYRRRLCRSQVYCACAVVGGVRLLSLCRWDPDDLLHIFTAEHQVFFTMAVGHWLVAIWEDMQCWRMLAAGMDSAVGQGGSEEQTARFLGQAYVVHHAVAALAFWSVVRLRSCVGIGIFGLVFELPVLLMNHREFVVSMQPRPAWFRNHRKLSRFWRDLNILFSVGRIGPAIVYVYSILFWQYALSGQSWSEAVAYHLAAVFFTILNRSLGVLLMGWQRSDFLALHKATGGQDLEDECRPEAEAKVFRLDAQMDRDVWGDMGAVVPLQAAEEKDEPPPKTPLMLKDIPEHEFYIAQGAAYQDGQIWLEIDGIVYDLSSFLIEHPGGAAVLKRFAGKDATEAFHRTKHSMRAKKLMSKYIIGRIIKSLASYRIFELGFSRVLYLARDNVFKGYMWPGLLVMRSVFGWSLRFPTESTLVGLAIPGLLLSFSVGMIPTMGCRFLHPHCTRQSALFGFCFVLQCMGFCIGRRPLPDTLHWACPTGLELAAAGMFLGEDILDLLRDRRFFSWRSLIPVAFAFVSWRWRGAGDLFVGAPEQFLGAALLALGTLGLLHGATHRQIPAIEEALVALPCAVAFSALALAIMYFSGPEVSQALSVVRGSPWLAWLVYTPVAVVSVAVALMTCLDHALSITASWASRYNANLLFVCVLFMGGWTSGYWVMWVAVAAHDAAVALRKRYHQDEMATTGEFTKLPEMIPMTRSFWDYTRMVNLTYIWLLLHVPVMRLMEWMLPEELTVYAYYLPIFSLGGEVQYGVGAYFAPQRAFSEKEAPSHFDLFAKHIDVSTEGGERDAMRSANELRAAWAKLRNAPPRGLAAQVSMLYPWADCGGLWKEFSLTSWHSEGAARDWSARDAAAAPLASDISNVEFHLKPRGPLRHQDRCKSCFRLIESDRPGEKAPAKCSACQGNVYGYTFF